MDSFELKLKNFLFDLISGKKSPNFLFGEIDDVKLLQNRSILIDQVNFIELKILDPISDQSMKDFIIVDKKERFRFPEHSLINFSFISY